MIRLLSRGLLVVHRYLGVGVGLLMTLWCLSGFVMLYQGFPSLTDAERLEGLQPLDLSACCDLDRLPFTDDQIVPGFRVEMLNGDPVIRFSGAPRRGAAVQNAPTGSYNLRTGEPVKTLGDAQVRQVAAEYAARHGLEGALVARRLDKVDQWTLQAGRRAPLYQIAVNDPAGSEIYVSAASGEVVQDTNRRERVLSWFGAIPHWLYPTVLRSNGALWTQVVIWTSVAGVFLTVTGLYVGISRFGRRKNGRWSPFRGLWYWHHIIGLAFGLFTLTWVLSGLLTMNPWGLLDGTPNNLRRSLTGNHTWAEAKGLIARVGHASAPGRGVAQLRSATFGGELSGVTVGPQGVVQRWTVAGPVQPLEAAAVRAVIENKASAPIAQFDLLTKADAYYYGFKTPVAWPVYRAILQDDQATRLYVDPKTAEVVRIADASSRASRWWRNGLHSLDVVRARPLWDGLAILLLAGVTLVCGTGAWMSIRRTKRDLTALRWGLADLSSRLAGRGRRERR